MRKTIGLTDQVDVTAQLHLFWHVGLPDRLAQDVVGLAELDGNHDPAMHCFVQVIGTVGGENYQAVVPILANESSRKTKRRLNYYLSISVRSRLT